MKKFRYFKEYSDYKGPTLIKFEKPMTIKLCELYEFLKVYEPFPCSKVWPYQTFEYGDFDNHVEAIIDSMLIDACYSHVYRKAKGIFKAGQTEFSVRSSFWYFKKNYPFWREAQHVGYSSFDSIQRKRYIDKVEVTVEGVYIISDSDMKEIENGNSIELTVLTLKGEDLWK